MFDPKTGKVVDREALRSLQFNGQGLRVPKTKIDRDTGLKHVESVNELTGGTAGWSSHHGSGRVDVTVTPETVKTSSTQPQAGA